MKKKTVNEVMVTLQNCVYDMINKTTSANQKTRFIQNEII